LKLPKLGWVRFQDDRTFTQPIKKATVKKTKSNAYYVSLQLAKQDDNPLLETVSEDRIEAFDMSPSNVLVSPTIKLETPQFYRKNEKKLKNLHRRHSRKKKGSKNREKARLELARASNKIVNQRTDWTHELTRGLTTMFDAVILEDLNIKGMQQFNSGLSKSVTLDFSWHHFTQLLKYKMEWEGKHLIFVDRFYPSSKTCSQCGWINNTLTLADRTWTCAECGTTHDRDINASINLKKEGLRILQEEKHLTITTSTVGTTGSHAFGDNVRLQRLYSELLEQLSMNKEAREQGKREHESHSFRKE